MNPIDHLGLRCSDLDRSLAFYRAALAALGMDVVMQVSAEESGGQRHVGFGRDGKPSFWIADGGRDAGTTVCTWPSSPPAAHRWTRSTAPA
ncbi:catechol 2,3-dioxygenase-like lactoylglutathione lyase family enzyme [Xanthomonas sp. 3498]|nr:catechol 2,3-dioxygenase-like lactoylglutathione lyase family enzyme [Xanthomonas sp. 3498]